jgi:hypothetical protein
MTQTSTIHSPTLLPDTSSQVVRQRWLDLLDWSYATRRVTGQEIEPGVHAVVVPAPCKRNMEKDLLEAEITSASGHVPELAQGVRLALGQLREFSLTRPEDYRGWMGEWGRDIASGETEITVFIELAYLEAAMLARLWDHGVIVDFGSPLAFFRRGTLTEYVNVYEAVCDMVADGRSLADTSLQLASEVLYRLQLYAGAFFQLSCLYSQATWNIERDNYIVKIPGSRPSLALQYWQLRVGSASGQKVLNDWRGRVEKWLQQAATPATNDLPKSFAA